MNQIQQIREKNLSNTIKLSHTTKLYIQRPTQAKPKIQSQRKPRPPIKVDIKHFVGQIKSLKFVNDFFGDRCLHNIFIIFIRTKVK
jgi:hypothetical protein